MAGHKNTFIKGMNKDMSKQKYPQDQYKNARNLRPLTDNGLSSGAMENIKGNALQNNFPVLGGFIDITPTPIAYEAEGTATNQIVNLFFAPDPGNTFAPYFSNTIGSSQFTSSSPSEYLDNVEAMIVTFNATIPPPWHIIIHRSTTNDRLILESPYHPIVQAGFGSVFHGLFTVVKKQENFTIIGSTSIRDKNILFTVNKVSSPSDEPGMGQIWISEYDPAYPTTNKELTLAYYGKLGFSIDHPIEAVANYENTEKQLIYWTDNFHPPRKLDIIDPNSFTLFPDELLLQNKAQLYPAYAGLEEQTGGALPTGIIYITYKLEKFGGSTTVTAPISAPIPITSDEIFTGGVDTNYEFVNYPLTTVGSNKSLQYTIPNIPKGYDKIYIYAIYEKDPDNYLAYRVEEQLLSNDSTFEFTLSSLGDKQKIPLVDLFTYDIDFERVKTMAVKDNQLLFGNIKQAAFDIDYDARAYRFTPASDNSYIGNISNSTITANPEDWGIDLKQDVINLHNDERTDSPSDDFRFQRNSSTIGGEGPNIKYRFIGRAFVLDQSSKAAPSNEEFNIGTGTDLWPTRTPLVNSPVQTTIDIPIRHRADETITSDFGPGFQNFKNNRFEGYFKGYMKDEVYRFGIVFYSLTGRPSEVKWIGDVRMPCDGDLSTSGQSCAFHSGRGAATHGTQNMPASTDPFRKNSAMGASLGIRFDVDVSSISDKISGYSIVRAPRREKDRSIIAQGTLGEVRETTLPLEDDRSTLFNYTRVSDAEGMQDNTKVWDYATFDSPDLKFVSGAKVDDYIDGRTDDEAYYFKPVGGYSLISQTNDSTELPELVGNSLSRYSKSLANLYTVNRDTRRKFVQWAKITDILKIGANQTNIDIGNKTFDNKGFLSDTPTPGSKQLVSPGCQTIITHNNNGTFAKSLINVCFGSGTGSAMQLDPASNSYGAYGFGTNSLRKGQTAIVDLCRHLDNQYGGATYNDTLNTEYISTGHYARVDPDDAVVGAEVYGGDIFICVFDEKKLYSRASRDVATGERISGSYVSPVIGKIYPICGIINTDMRVGFHLNNYIQGGGGDIDLREEAQDDYLIPIMFHREKTLQKYLVTGAGANLVGEYDTRVYISQPKTNGEFSDSWSSVKPLNYKDVDGEYGPLNKLAILNDRAMWWQDRGFGHLAINPRAVVQSIDGAELEMGTGRNITDYTYISNSTGAFHQWGVILARSAAYWFDAVHKKFCRFSSKLEVLSDSKLMSSFFHNEVVDGILSSDNPIILNGVTGTYDFKFNEVLMTFHSTTGPSELNPIPDQVNDAVQDVAAVAIGSEVETIRETIVYNENIDAFSGFYDHFPRHYVNDGRRIFSQDPDGFGIYVHDYGDRTTFYEVYHPCKLDLVINPKGDHTKVFNNLEFFTEVEDPNGLDEFNETLTKARYFNEYQNTGDIILTPNDNVQRRMRTWRTAIPRDTDGSNSRIRNPYMQLELEFNRIDTDDKRLVIHDIISHYVDVPM